MDEKKRELWETIFKALQNGKDIMEVPEYLDSLGYNRDEMELLVKEAFWEFMQQNMELKEKNRRRKEYLN